MPHSIPEGRLNFDWSFSGPDIWQHLGADRTPGDGRQEYGVSAVHTAGDPVPSYTWRCGCDCHTGPDPQRYEPHGDKWPVAGHSAKPKRLTFADEPEQLSLFELVAS